MGAKGKNPNPIYLVPDLVEEIFLRLPLKSILRFKTVSKKWISIVESKMFVERRMKVPKKRKILAAYNCDCGDRPSLVSDSRFEGDEEIVHLHCNAARPSMTCNGLVCFPEPDLIVFLNPSTGQILRFPVGTDPVSSRSRSDHFLGDRIMGFGRDKDTGNYKVVKIFGELREKQCDVLDVESGEWKNLRLPPYVICVGRESVCVNGSIYWFFMGLLHIGSAHHILAFDLHKEVFHTVSVPDLLDTREIGKLEDRLAIANARRVGTDRILEIWSMNANEETWSKTFSISLASLDFKFSESMWYMSFRPVAVSKQGNLVFSNNHNRLLKYYPETDKIRFLSFDTRVISSPYLENLAPIQSKSGHHPNTEYRDYRIRTSRCRSFFSKHPEPGSEISQFLVWIRDIVILTIVAAGYVLIDSLTAQELNTATMIHKWWKEESQIYTSNRAISTQFEMALFLFLFFIVYRSRSPLFHFP